LGGRHVVVHDASTGRVTDPARRTRRVAADELNAGGIHPRFSPLLAGRARRWLEADGSSRVRRRRAAAALYVRRLDAPEHAPFGTRARRFLRVPDDGGCVLDESKHQEGVVDGSRRWISPRRRFAPGTGLGRSADCSLAARSADFGSVAERQCPACHHAGEPRSATVCRRSFLWRVLLYTARRRRVLGDEELSPRSSPPGSGRPSSGRGDRVPCPRVTWCSFAGARSCGAFDADRLQSQGRPWPSSTRSPGWSAQQQDMTARPVRHLAD